VLLLREVSVPLRQHAKKRSNSQKLKKMTFFAVFSRWIKAYPLATALGTVGESFSQKTGRS
jgi:hypothetical protein